jgi:UDP-N-acetyl-D-mannosaminuronate dehydrogenase
MSSPEALELAKLMETTYFGVLVSWAQEMNRFAGAVDADYWETTAFMEEIDFFPPVVFEPGYIGGHCVMPNLELLEQVRRSRFIDVMRESNASRERELQERGLATATRLSPRPTRGGRAE